MRDITSPDRLAEEGKQRFHQEDYTGAAEIFARAEQGYRAAGQDLDAAEMANNRSVSLLQAEDYDAALQAVEGTEAIFAAAGDKKRQAIAIGNRAAALAALGHKEQAESSFWESARLLEEVGETDMRASVLQSISRLQMGQGRYMQAIASMESGLEKLEKPSLPQRLLKRLLKIPGNLLNRSS